AHGLATSPVEPLPAERGYLIEGRSLLYLALLHAIHGPIPEGHDVFLTPTAFAGWAGLLVTMINLLPVAQLDGGHVAYALLGPRQDAISERLRRALPALAVLVGAGYWLDARVRGDTVGMQNDWLAGLPWLVWAAVLWLLVRMGGVQHPPVEGPPLGPVRRAVAFVTLALFVLLFMPAWVRQR
ncbi:MAG: site-2 protease family protein, partial [Myxococcota bacterium]|nr:site-2 protease family protein [Myxococcota bacterium]